ncbi:MAG: TetR/AcrR family transcriptional regulator [Acidimicrobiales bacterium]
MGTTDPRIARTRATVLDTAAAIVVEQGTAALTVDAVVARSGVARSTIYRHWPTRDDLLVDVFEHCVPSLVTPSPELGFEAAMRQFLHAVVDHLADAKWNRMLPALMALKAYEPTLARVEERMEERQGSISADLFARGEREGMFGPELDRSRAMTLLVGPLVFAALSGETPITPELADASLSNFLAGLSRPDPAR